MSEFFAVPDRWILPEYVWRQSFEDMAIDGRRDCETTNLSYPDRYLGMCEPGYLSLVAPDFALRVGTKLEDCGVHVHEGVDGWRRLGVAETQRRFDRIAGSPRPPLVIGADR